jgi:hypothetical protein
MKLRCNAKTQDFWNGETYVQFVNGEYEAKPHEVEHLIKCMGVEIVGGEVVAAPTPPTSTPRKRKGGK